MGGVNRHPSSERFHQLLTEIGELHDRKQADYGTEADPFNNVRQSAQDWGAPAVGGSHNPGDGQGEEASDSAPEGKPSQ
jgi:hypothetical protein